jgi:type II secretory pathway pseudopilin PulG
MKPESLVVLVIVIIMSILIGVSFFNRNNYRIEKEKTKQLELTLEMTKITHGITNKIETVVNPK